MEAKMLLLFSILLFVFVRVCFCVGFAVVLLGGLNLALAMVLGTVARIRQRLGHNPQRSDYVDSE